MADKAPEVKPIEALTFYEAKPVNKGGLSKELSESIDSGKKYRDLLAKDVPAATVWEQMRASTDLSISERQFQDMMAQFGAGMTKSEHGVVSVDTKQIPKDMPHEQRAIEASFDAGSKAIESVRSYLRYAEVVQEANASKRMPADVIKEKYPGENWIDLRKNALDQLAATGIFQNMDSKFNTYGPHHQHEIIEQYLAADPALKNKVGQAMKAIETKMTGLQKVEKGQDYEQIQGQQKQALEKMDTNIQNYVRQLQGYGLIKNRDDIKAAILAGQAPDQILLNIKQELISADEDLKNLSELEEAQRKHAVADAERAKFTTKTDDDYKRSVLERLKDSEDKIKDINQKFTDKKMSAVDIEKKLNIYNNVKNLTDVSKGGASLQQARAEYHAYEDLEKSLAGRGSKAKKDEQAALSTRLREESQITQDLENVLRNAIVDVMIDRSGKVLEAKNKEQAEKEEKDKEAKDKTEAEMKKKVKEGIENNWIKYEKGKRKKTVDKKAIGDDMKVITYEGNEGVKRLMLRDMQIPGVDWQYGDLDSLNDDTKRYLNAAFEESKDTYRDKLLTDYFVARASGGNNRDLNLKDHEWELLNRHFSGVLEQRLNESKHARDVLKKLEESGIKPSLNLKWLLFVLAGLGGAAALGAGYAIGPGPLAGSPGLRSLAGQVGNALRR